MLLSSWSSTSKVFSNFKLCWSSKTRELSLDWLLRFKTMLIWQWCIAGDSSWPSGVTRRNQDFDALIPVYASPSRQSSRLDLGKNHLVTSSSGSVVKRHHVFLTRSWALELSVYTPVTALLSSFLPCSDHCINISTDKCLQRSSTQTQKQAQSRSFEQLKGLRTSSPRSPSWTLQMRLTSYLDIKFELKSGEISRSSLNVNVARPHESRRKREEAHDNRLFN